MYQALRINFPKEYHSLTAKVTNLVNSNAPTDSISNVGQQELLRFRKEYASHLSNASDKSIKNYLSAYLVLTRKVLETEGTNQCGRFVEVGADAIDMKRYAREGEDVWVALISALSPTNQINVGSSEASDADYEALYTQMKQNGVPEIYIKLLLSEDSKHKYYCNALIYLFESTINLDGPVGERLRATMSKGLAEG